MATSDFLLFCSFLLSALFLGRWVLIKSRRNQQKECEIKGQQPPGPMALPVIGHLHYLVGPALVKSLQNLARQYGPLMLLRLGGAACYVVSDAKFAKEILKTNELNFVSRPDIDTSVYNIYKGSAFITAPYDAYWRFMKKLCMTRLLSTTQLNQLSHIREDETLKLLRLLADASRNGESCDVKTVLMAMTNNVICRMAMSIDCSEDANEAREIKELVDQISELGGKLSAGILGPLAKLDIFGYGKQLGQKLGRFDQIVDRIIEEHEQKDISGNGGEGRDLLDILLETSRDPNAEVKLTRTQIKAFFLDIVMAGTDTSSLAMQWSMAELINHPEVFKKLRQEIISVVGENRLVKESDVQNLPYLQAVVKETLRLYPTAPLFIRVCNEDCTIKGFRLKGKTRMLFNSYAINRDPASWTDPDEFFPERYIGGNSEMNFAQSQMEMRGQNFSYLPFGSGRRGCPGASLALTVMHATLGALVQCFDWEFKDGDKVDMEEGKGFTMGMANPLMCYPALHLDPSTLTP
ncbi:hypothetical protein Tsubulata_044447 [Turnera subulata]|uniref:3,9-dihydroxypterocarpan 6A-monooxygenase n=1 Tax=Turnera subulata TaxID=218843 RepID=A0A9Q0FRM4_9ROSI|nr:hypothetical protein Tsubulata_044447 [Turnera subulata]